MPLADRFYFPGGGNSVTFMTPGGIEGIAARMAYSCVSGLFSLIWDEAETTEVPEELAQGHVQPDDPDLAAHVRRAEVREHARIQAVRRRPTTST